MAKRKRLTPFGAPEVEDLPEIIAPSVRPPIADMAGASAATAAMEEMAATLRSAREGGRLVLSLPLDQVEAGYLVRDRIASDPEEMAALVESLRARGQQTPIEVAQIGPDRYGLISGWRRLSALRQLAAEGAESVSVLALLRKPDQASDAYIAMVEENEIRVGLSFYERARIAAKAVEAGVYPDDRSALRALFAAASRAKRSKIGSFLAVVRALDGTLRFPESIGERLGLQLAQALEADAGLGPRLAAELATRPAPDAAAEQARLAKAMQSSKPALTALTETIEPIPGLRLRQEKGRVVLEGPRADAALAQRLAEWLKTQA
ncbi:MAG TPA: ParB N-terminal domain-containing protein [Gemmobacter sp.]|nr:ParB N-terminal domain-containing protein [Gemmobacter sp.]